VSTVLTGAPLARLPAAFRVGALCCLLAFLGSCREAEAPTGPESGSSLIVVLTPGTRLVFDDWLLDRYGDRIPESFAHRSWSVIAESVKAKGHDDVTIVIDSVAGTSVDTLLFRFTPSGDVYQYGFVARFEQRWGGRTIPQQWDLIAGFSLGLVSSWTVGISDSLGTLRMEGESVGRDLMFEAAVNGVATVFQAYRVTCLTENLDGVFYLADQPPAFTYMRWENYVDDLSVTGEISVLVSLTIP